tara:strand:+ start:63 stop:605 length:543 start_codon:yes stop_codon:yes gene_type:complete
MVNANVSDPAWVPVAESSKESPNVKKVVADSSSLLPSSMKLSGATGTAEDEHGTADDEPPVEARGGTFDRILYSLTELRRGKCGELGNLRKRRDVRRLCAALYFITMMAVLVSFLGSGGHAGISVGENPIGILGKDPSISKLSSTLSKQHFSNMNSKAETPSSSIGILGLKDQSQLSSTL